MPLSPALPIATAQPSARERPASWRAWLAALMARRAESLELRALSDRELRDIGLTRDEADALAAKPLWRA